MKKRKLIKGAGGDDSGPRAAVVAADTLTSSSYIQVVDLLCEGEIEGLVNGDKSIFIDSTPLQSANGAYNFDDAAFDYETRNGTQSQSYISGFSSVENEVTVSAEFKNGLTGPGTAIVRQITNPNLNRVRVRISFPQLNQTNVTNGDVSGSSVTFSVWLQPSSGAYSKVVDRTVTGKASSKYEVTTAFDLTGTGPWNIRVQRDSADAVDSYTQNKTVFESYTEIVDAKLRYPNSALVGIKLLATQFSSVPSRYYDVKLLRIKLPTNYDPVTRKYTGVWDGTFKVAWSDNPAWIFYDLMTNTRYGLGSFVGVSQIDKWTLYRIGKYCDCLVPNGFGGMEPRFTCNMLLSDREDAYTVLQHLASVFRGMIYWSAGTVTASQDAPLDPSYLYTAANVVNGAFTYQGASAKTRHSVCTVQWNDPENFYKPAIEYVEDQDAIAKFGVQETQVVAVGCTSRGQAHRFGKWLLYTEQHESEMVSFQTGIEGVTGAPGQVIAISDPSRAGQRMGGRVSSGTLTSVTLDQQVPYFFRGSISVLLPNGVMEERAVDTHTDSTLTVSTPFSVAPSPQSVWMLKSDALQPELFRVIGVREEDSIFTMTAISHDPSKFAFIENNIALQPKSYSVLSSSPDAPVNLVISEGLYQSAAEVKTRVTCAWDNVARASSYLVSFKFGSGNYVDLPETSSNSVDVMDASPGIYTFRVTALNSLGKSSSVSVVSKEIFGKTAPPGDVQNFSMIPSAGLAMFSWDRSIDLDVIVGGFVRIRYSPLTAGALWKNSVDIVPSISGAATNATAPLLTGTYMAKFVDSSGNFSVNEHDIVTTVPEIQALNIVSTFSEDPAYSGIRTKMEYTTTATSAGLSITAGNLIDTYMDFDAITSLDNPGQVSPYGQYDFSNTVDLGGVWPSRIMGTIDLEAFDILNYLDERLDVMDSWTDLDGNVINDVNAELYVSTTNDNPSSSSAVWTVWKKLSIGEYLARGMKFQLRCTTESETHNLLVKHLSVRVDMDDRILNIPSLVSSTSAATHVSFTEAFFAAPSIGITAQNMLSGDYYQYSNLTASGFDVSFFNSSNVLVSRNFSIIAKGFGRKVA